MSLDVHAREARAERRWAGRGASLPARLLHWLARAWPWAWRVRFDLIVLFNVASWLIFLALAQILTPVLIARTRAFVPDFAVSVATTISVVTALSFAVSWAFAVSKSTRLREAARHGAQPGIVLTSLVFLSFAGWIVAVRAAPHVDTLRHPLFGQPIEQSILERLPESAWPPGMGEAHGAYVPVVVDLAARRRPSQLVCAPPPSTERHADERKAFLCGLARTARRASLLEAITFDARLEEWRTAQNISRDGPSAATSALTFDAATRLPLPWAGRSSASPP